MLHWFQKQLVTEESAQWMTECADWIIESFNQDIFFNHTQLITPDGQYFPKPVDSPQEMADYILQRVVELSSLTHLPWKIASPNDIQSHSPALLPGKAQQRTTATNMAIESTGLPSLEIPFVQEQTKKPQDLVANIANGCAQHLLWQSQLTPPGGREYFLQAAEMLAIFMGFGIVMVNSAYNFRGSCSKCYDPRANRQAQLSEAETLFGLALFCERKKIPAGNVLKHLKAHLKNDYKVATKQIRLATVSS